MQCQWLYRALVSAIRPAENPSAPIGGTSIRLSVERRARWDPEADALPHWRIHYQRRRRCEQRLRRWRPGCATNPPTPDRATLASAVRLTARALAAQVPGKSVELRIPPFVAVQCISGPAHTRGTPPNVVETDPRTWLLIASGTSTRRRAAADGRIELSGSRAAEIAAQLPLVSLGAGQHHVPAPRHTNGDTPKLG